MERQRACGASIRTTHTVVVRTERLGHDRLPISWRCSLSQARAQRYAQTSSMSDQALTGLPEGVVRGRSGKSRRMLATAPDEKACGGGEQELQVQFGKIVVLLDQRGLRSGWAGLVVAHRCLLQEGWSRVGSWLAFRLRAGLGHHGPGESEPVEMSPIWEAKLYLGGGVGSGVRHGVGRVGSGAHFRGVLHSVGALCTPCVRVSHLRASVWTARRVGLNGECSDRREAVQGTPTGCE